jgi:hypothetical protein
MLRTLVAGGRESAYVVRGRVNAWGEGFANA